MPGKRNVRTHSATQVIDRPARLDHSTLESKPTPVERLPYPTEDQIRDRAYRIFVQRGCIPGNPIVDWIDAEHQLLHEMARVKP